MRRPIAILPIIAVVFIAGLTVQAQAQDRQSLSHSNGRSGQGVRYTKCQPVRVDDKGRPQVLWSQQVVYRALNNTNIYLHEGRATIRDEVASQAIILHTQGNGVRPGHVYHTRDN